VRAADVEIAVATNFARPMERIASDFARDTGHRPILVAAATGTLFAQIEHGAPFDVLLSADSKAPERLEADAPGVAGTRFTYAFGTRVLWTANPGTADGGGAVRAKGAFRHLAVANPELAPYGAAALETLRSLHRLEAVRSKIVEADSIGQTFQFVANGNAELGLVALAQVVGPGLDAGGSFWVVPAHLHAPIQQDAVLLRHGTTSDAARAFCAYLRSERSKSVIRAYGYRTSLDEPVGPR
jgi:molybdate transport system substrate-binding protein